MFQATHEVGTGEATLTREAFVQHALQMGGQFIGLATVSTFRTVKDSELIKAKTSGNSGRIQQASRFSCGINPHYENQVNLQRGKETPEGEYMTEFEAKPRKWGNRLYPSALVAHKGKHYLEVSVYKVIETFWFLDGQPVEKADIAHMMRQKGKEGERQQVADPRIWRDYEVKNVTKIVWYSPSDKITYTLNLEG